MASGWKCRVVLAGSKDVRTAQCQVVFSIKFRIFRTINFRFSWSFSGIFRIFRGVSRLWTISLCQLYHRKNKPRVRTLPKPARVLNEHEWKTWNRKWRKQTHPEVVHYWTSLLTTYFDCYATSSGVYSSHDKGYFNRKPSGTSAAQKGQPFQIRCFSLAQPWWGGPGGSKEVYLGPDLLSDQY